MATITEIYDAIKDALNGNVNKLHVCCRKGCSSSLRSQVWIKCIPECNISPNLDKDLRDYNISMETILRNTEIDYSHFPLFGGRGVWFEHIMMDEEKKKACVRILYLVHETNYITYAPQLFDLICILLLYVPECRVYKMVQRMIEISQKDHKYLILSEKDDRALMTVIHDYIQKYSTKTIKNFFSHYETLPELELYSSWIHRYFETWFPQDTVLRIFDTYLIDGIVVYIKEIFAVMDSIAHIEEDSNYRDSIEETLLILKAHVFGFSPVPEQDTLRKAYAKFSSITPKTLYEDIKQEEQLHPIHKTISSVSLADIYKYHNIRIWDGTLLTNALYVPLRDHLPYRVLGKDLKSVYNSTIHGYNLHCLYKYAQGISPSLFVGKIQETGTIFGIFREEEWMPIDRPSGGLDLLLIRFTPQFKCWKAKSPLPLPSGDSSPTLDDDEPSPTALLTLKHKRFVYVISTNADINVGLGCNQGVSFSTNDDFSVASSQRSVVFDNEPLGDDLEFFTLETVELYSFVEPVSV
ncbi:hypothetical protein WA158_004329 [Blastocystis sp. Blastoise]